MRLLVAVLALGLLAGCTSGGTPQHATPPSGAAYVLPGCPAQAAPSTSATALPDLQLPCLGDAGAEVPLRRLTGRPTVLNLWASWCAPCKEELPAFARLSTAARGKVEVVGVASKDDPGRSVEYAGRTGLPFPSLQDEAGSLLRALRRVGLPATVLLRPDGSVADVYQGQPLTDTSLRKLVKDKLGVDV
ncbi:MAG TPA: TlpA disulfide reductase family protein [Mycobacteriales bacterium]|nr:TlpA disulfide reductase family protein [Mycobacteriales bacterium]